MWSATIRWAREISANETKSIFVITNPSILAGLFQAMAARKEKDDVMARQYLVEEIDDDFCERNLRVPQTDKPMQTNGSRRTDGWTDKDMQM